MFGIGYLELMVLGLLVILLFPPRELPKLARQAARAYGSVRRIADEFHRTVMLDEDLRSPIDEIRGAYDEARWDIRRAGDRFKEEISSAGQDMQRAVQGGEPVEPPNEEEQAYLDHGPSEFDTEPGTPDAASSEAPVAPIPPATSDVELPSTPPVAPPSPAAPPAAPAPTPEVGEDDVTPFAPSLAAMGEPEYQSPYGAAKPGSAPLGARAPVPGRVAATSSSLPGSAPRTVENLLDGEPQAAPGLPAKVPATDSDKIDDSALTRVTRLPMPPSAGEAPSSDDGAPNKV